MVQRISNSELTKTTKTTTERKKDVEQVDLHVATRPTKRSSANNEAFTNKQTA